MMQYDLRNGASPQMSENTARDNGGLYRISASTNSEASLSRNAGFAGLSRFAEEEDAPAITAMDAAPNATGPEHQDEITSQDSLQPAAPAPLPLYKRRWFKLFSIAMVPIGIGFLFILLFPVVRAIAQLVINKSGLSIRVVQISQPQNTSFSLALVGFATHTGFIPAKIHFTEPVDVSWLNGNEVVPLGTMELHDLKTSGKKKLGAINDTTTFQIRDEDAFGRFSAYLITAKNFTWRLESRNLRVRAASFPVAKGIKFKKDLTLNGFNSFDGNVLLRDLKLPSDNPKGGMDFVAVTSLNNSSPFSLNLGTVVFSMTYKDMNLGTGTGHDVIISPGENNITLAGVLVPHTSDAEVKLMSELFTSYLNGETSPVLATGQSTLQNDNTEISWLSKGLKSLKLNVPFKSFVAIDPIKSINVGNLDLAFSPEKSWSPNASSNSVQASMALPFGFHLSIDQIQNDFNLVAANGQPVAGLSTPVGASTSSIQILGPTDTRGTINITIANTSLTCPDAQHPTFSAFNANLTAQDKAEFRLIGHSRAVANTSVGRLTLDPIKVNVSTSLLGLKGLKGMTTIHSLDVMGGDQDAMHLNINTSIMNPSNLNLKTADLRLSLSRNGGLMGTVLMSNLNLNMGNNTLAATSNFQPNASPDGLETLNRFVAGNDTEINISGYDGSTQVASLAEAFKTLNISATLPGLKSKLLESAALKVLSTTGHGNNITHVSVNLSNPFSSDITITKIVSNVSTFGINLGNIEFNTRFLAVGKKTTPSPDLDLDLNFDPSSVFTVTRTLALQAGLDVTPLDGITALAGIDYLPTSSGPPQRRRLVSRANIFTGFDLPKFVDAAFKNLKSDVQLQSDVSIGGYQTTLKFTQMAVPTATDDSLNFLLSILAEPIVQKIVDNSVLGIDTVIISNPQQTSFDTALKGSITNAGPFDAKISFPQGLTVSWAGGPLGSLKMDSVTVVGDVGANVDLKSAFQIADVGHLTDFTRTLLTEDSFDWEITGDNLTVSALGIDVPGIRLSTKKVTLKGMSNLKNGVKINSYNLPSNDPSGGIHLTLETTVTNPSQVGVELPGISFNTFFNNIAIAPVQSTGDVKLSPGGVSSLALVGRLIPQSSPEGLAAVSTIFNNVLHGKDSDVVVQGAGVSPSGATWLNDAITALKISTVLPNIGPLDIIKAIKINDLTLMFSDKQAYSPPASTKSTDVSFTLPFNFPVDITALQQKLIVGAGGVSIAELNVPKGPSSTDVQNRIIHVSFNDVPFAVYGDKHAAFDNFVLATTVRSSGTLSLSGSANADASTAVGVLSLQDIKFAVDTSLAGLQGLNAKPVIVSNLDVNHGSRDFLLINTDSTINNPSNLTIGTGDVAFGLQFENQDLGTVNANNLVLKPGDVVYPMAVHYAPRRDGAAQAAGRQLLQNFLQGVDSQTTIQGSTDSTRILSLKKALSQIHLSPVNIPALHQKLITSTSLTFPEDIAKTGTASTTFDLSNPFTASINMLVVTATATFQDLTLGKIDRVDRHSNPIHAPGHSNITSPALPFKLNADPATIVKLLGALAHQNNVDLGPLVQMFQIVLANPNFKLPITTSIVHTAPQCTSGHEFDFAGAILRALQGLRVNLAIETSVKLDDFAQDLSIQQNDIPVVTDKSALFLIQIVGPPVVQTIVDGSELAFNNADITNVSDDGFDLALNGSLTKVGPLDALITFPEPVTVTWEGSDIAKIALPPACAAANDGIPNYTPKARLTITNLGRFTDFAKFLLHNPSFEWTISTKKLRVTALGTAFDNVSLTKKISLKAFNNLPGVTISNFQLPSNDPAGGIHIETDADIPSSAQLGIDLGAVGFQTFFQGTNVGPLQSQNLVLAANSVTKSHLSGRITPKSGNDLHNMGILFSDFLQGKNQTLTTKGDFVRPSGSKSPVSWLSNAFKTLELEVILPGQKLTVIESITISDLALKMQNQAQAFDPLASSKHTVASYKNPFGFSLQAVQSATDLIINSGTDIAELKLPMAPAVGGVSTGNVVDLVLSYQGQTLHSLNNGAFALLLAAVTLSPTIPFTLKGSADVVARTPIGDVPITGIPINVESSITGMNSLGKTAGLRDISVTGSGGNGGNEFIVAPLTTTIANPSNISLLTVDVSLPAKYKGSEIGRALITPLDLIPGSHDYKTEFHYSPPNANDTVAQSFLTDFLTTANDLPLTIDGDTQSSPFPSLSRALDSLILQTSIKGANAPPIVQHINVYVTMSTLVDNLVSVDIDIFNPLGANLVVEFVQSSSGVNGETFAFFRHSFSQLVVPARGKANTGKFGDVKLVKGAVASLPIIPLGKLDVAMASTVRVSQGGYQVPWLQLKYNDVPTEYHVDLNGLSPEAAMKAIASSSIAATAKTSSGGSPSTSNSPAKGTTEAAASPPPSSNAASKPLSSASPSA